MFAREVWFRFFKNYDLAGGLLPVSASVSILIVDNFEPLRRFPCSFPSSARNRRPLPQTGVRIFPDPDILTAVPPE